MKRVSGNLPLVDTFVPAYEVWETRPATLDEMIANGGPGDVKVSIIESVSDAPAAASHIARSAQDNALSNHIQTALSKSHDYSAWLRAMPSKTPPEISRYQKKYGKCDLSAVSNEIEQIGSFLSDGQFLFHGGLWPPHGPRRFVTTRPLSTSLCPQVALRNAEFRAKAYDAGRIDLLVLRAVDLRTKAYVFKRKGTKLGHESEVLLASGACLTLKAETLIRADYPAAKCDHPNKDIPIYVLEVEFS